MAKDASTKRVLIDKANQRVVIVTSVAAFVVVFCLVASHTLFSQLLYQNRIVSAKKQALSQLKTDETTTQNLYTAYEAFVNTPQNALGGDPNGTGSNDGDNAKIVLDALPSQYDFPALATSLQNLLASQGVTINNIGGSDDEVAQSSQKPSGNPQSVQIPFQASVTGNYEAVKGVIDALGASIRPVQIQSLNLSGDDASLSAAITAQTYYQPEKAFTITTKVIK